MKDNIIKIWRTLIWLIISGYVSWLFYLNSIITKSEFISYNKIIMIFLIILGIGIIIMWLTLFCLNRPKIQWVIMWISLILLSHIFLQDNPNNMIFIWDILNFIWLFICVISPTWACIPNKCIKKSEQSKIEIIEV